MPRARASYYSLQLVVDSRKIECALAGPVFDASGTPVGAIGLVIPSANWPADAATRDATRDAARAISRELGATTWPARR